MEEKDVRECIKKAVADLKTDLSVEMEDEITETTMSYSDPPDEGLVEELVRRWYFK